MTTEESLPPESLERALAGRSDEADAEAIAGGITPEELTPKQLFAIATTADEGLEDIAADIDWPGFLKALESLEEDEYKRLLRRLIQHLGTRSGTGVASKEGIEAIGKRVYELRHRHPDLLLQFLHEIRPLLRRDPSSETLEAVNEQFELIAKSDSRVSNQRIEKFREADIRSRLVDPDIGTQNVVELLKNLASEDPAELPVDFAIKLLVPLRNNYGNPEVERAVLRTVESWARQFPSYERDGDDVVDTLESFLAGEREELSEPLLMELLVTGFVGPAIVDWLVDHPTVHERTAVVTAAFEALERTPGLRMQAESLCDFLLSRQFEDEALLAGIETLQGLLVGLTPHQHTESPAQSDHMRQILFSDEELSVDERIRETFREIVASENVYSAEVRMHAVEAWLSVRPPEIHDVLWDIRPDAIGEDPVADAKLRAAAEHRLVEFVDLAEKLWASVSEDPERIERLVGVLEDLETKDLVPLLLEPAFDHEDERVQRAAREALADSGYKGELDREGKRRTIVDRIEQRYDSMSTATETDREIRDQTKTQFSLEADRDQTRVESAEAVSKSVDTLSSFRASGGTEMLRLAPLFERLEQLAAEIRQLENRIQELEQEVDSELEEARRLKNEIQRVESEIRSTESDLSDARSEKDNVERRIEEIRSREIPGVKSDIREVESRISSVERKEPTRRPNEDENEFQRRYRNWESELDSLRNDRGNLRRQLDSLQDELNSAERRRGELENEIRRLKSKLSDLRSEHKQLSTELDQSMSRISSYRDRLESLIEELETLREQYRKTQRQIDDIVGHLKQVRDQATSRRQRLKRDHEAARSEAGDLRDELRSVVDTRSVAESRRADVLERIQDLATRLEDDHDEFEDLGERTKSETPATDREAVETAIDVANEQYDRNVAEWRFDSILRRVADSDTLEEDAPELVDQARREAPEPEGWR